MTTSALRRPPTWVVATSLGLSLVAVAIASYLTVAHYADPSALACPDTGVVNCTLVTTSPESVVFGIPLAVIGLVWALAVVGLCLPWAWRAQARVGRPRPTLRNGSWSAHGRVPRLHRAVSHRRHLLVVHRNACDSARAFRRGHGGAGESRYIGDGPCLIRSEMVTFAPTAKTARPFTITGGHLHERDAGGSRRRFR